MYQKVPRNVLIVYVQVRLYAHTCKKKKSIRSGGSGSNVGISISTSFSISISISIGVGIGISLSIIRISKSLVYCQEYPTATIMPQRQTPSRSKQQGPISQTRDVHKPLQTCVQGARFTNGRRQFRWWFHHFIMFIFIMFYNARVLQGVWFAKGRGG